MLKKIYFQGYKVSTLFEDDEVFELKNVLRDEVLTITQPLMFGIKEALDLAFDYAEADREQHFNLNYLVPRHFSDNVYAAFVAKLQNVSGCRIVKNRNNKWPELEIEGGIRVWVRKLNKKLLVNSTSISGNLKKNQKTRDRNDIRPVIILGYVANEQNTGYKGLYFTQQKGTRLNWCIDIMHELSKQALFIRNRDVEKVDLDTELAVKEDAISIRLKKEVIQ